MLYVKVSQDLNVSEKCVDLAREKWTRRCLQVRPPKHCRRLASAIDDFNDYLLKTILLSDMYTLCVFRLLTLMLQIFCNQESLNDDRLL